MLNLNMHMSFAYKKIIGQTSWYFSYLYFAYWKLYANTPGFWSELLIILVIPYRHWKASRHNDNSTRSWDNYWGWSGAARLRTIHAYNYPCFIKLTWPKISLKQIQICMMHFWVKLLLVSRRDLRTSLCPCIFIALVWKIWL